MELLFGVFESAKDDDFHFEVHSYKGSAWLLFF